MHLLLTPGLGFVFLVSSLLAPLAGAAEPPLLSQHPQFSGIFPHLAFFNDEGECGTGAVVPWADRLWVVTYAPHKPKGSSDKLYEITPELELIVRPESIGGTPANRMIHPESGQLFIGPHAIDSKGTVRTIPYGKMFGRPTGNARHLTDPENKILYATMEEGIYEVDVKTLEVTELWRDEQLEGGRKAGLPGYHGKGFYSGQGRYVYANNGEHGNQAKTDPTVPSGVLAEWDGKAGKWTVVRRNQFTEVTGPGGILGSADPENDPIWSIGWDHRSLILMCLHQGKWHSWRLPKASHSYDGAHGWNTEWPRIRDIGGDDLLMTMHGSFWRFPKGFSPIRPAGILPRSNYLKVIGDFALWKQKVVFGCDDTARSEFLNKRLAKGEIPAPQSQSNLWFVDPGDLDRFGPPIGRGAVWVNEPVKAGVASDAFLIAGFNHRCLHLAHESPENVTFVIEVDYVGNNQWAELAKVEVPPGEIATHEFKDQTMTWIRIRPEADCAKASAAFFLRARDLRPKRAANLFASLAKPGDPAASGGLLLALGDGSRQLAFAATAKDGKLIGHYRMDETMKLTPIADKDPATVKDHERMMQRAAIPTGSVDVDEASAIFIDEDGSRWRLPMGERAFDIGGTFGNYRIAREVATERDLLNVHGSFYELPARNAGGVPLIRPVATHNRMIHDFCSYRGLLVISGISATADPKDPHLVRSDDGKASLWVGAVDDLWKLGKPHGSGGPWKDSKVKAGSASDPYLMTGYDQKSLTLQTDRDTTVTAEIDITGRGDWKRWNSFQTQAGKPLEYSFPPGFSAYWIRFSTSDDCTATARLKYH